LLLALEHGVQFKTLSKASAMFRQGKLDDIVGLIVLVITILVIVANVMVCLLVLTTKRLRTDINGFVVSLAMSDTITTAMMLGSLLTVVHDPSRSEAENTFATIPIRFITLSGVANLCAVAYDRYMAVVKPLQYKTRSCKFFVGIMAAVWVGSACVSLLYLLRLSSASRSTLTLIHQFSILLFIVAPFVFIVAMYVCIFMVIRKQRRRTRDLQAAQRRPIAMRQKKEIKIVKIFLVVATLYIVSWIPALLQETVPNFKNFYLPGLKTSLASLQIFGFGTVLSSLLNPFIYTFAKQDFRREIQRIYRKRIHGTAPSIPDRN